MHVCYTEKPREARQRPERQNSTHANRKKQRRPNETKPHSDATHPHKRQNYACAWCLRLQWFLWLLCLRVYVPCVCCVSVGKECLLLCGLSADRCTGCLVAAWLSMVLGCAIVLLTTIVVLGYAWPLWLSPCNMQYVCIFAYMVVSPKRI